MHSLSGESWSSNSAFTFGRGGEISTLSPVTVWKGITSVPRTHKQWSSWHSILLITICTKEPGSIHSPLPSRRELVYPGVLTQTDLQEGQSETVIHTNTRDNQMVKGKQKPRLLGNITTQFSHHSKFWIPHHTGKARVGFKIKSNDTDRGV